MTPQEEREFVKGAFQKLKERGWFPGQEFEPSTITEEEIAAFERKHQVKLPSLYKTFLMSYWLPRNRSDEVCAIHDDDGYLCPLWQMIDSPRSMDEVSKRMEILQEIRDFCELPEGCFRNLIPIGDWGAGWGPLCIDLSRPEENIDPDNEFTWSLVWFDHEEFDWDKMYLCDDGLLHGKEAAPDLKAYLEIYFYGSLEAKFEREEGVKPTYQWYLDTLKR